MINGAPAARDSWFVGLLAQRSFGDQLSLGAEVFRRTSTAAGEPSAAGFNVGAIIKVAADQNLLVSAGRGLTEVETWFGIVAPAGTPRDIRDKLNAQVQRALAQDDTKRRLAALGMSAGGGSADEFGTYIKAEIAKWTKVVREADIKAQD